MRKTNIEDVLQAMEIQNFYRSRDRIKIVKNKDETDRN